LEILLINMSEITTMSRVFILNDAKRFWLTLSNSNFWREDWTVRVCVWRNLKMRKRFLVTHTVLYSSWNICVENVKARRYGPQGIKSPSDLLLYLWKIILSKWLKDRIKYRLSIRRRCIASMGKPFTVKN